MKRLFEAALGRTRPRVLVFIDLVQDIDALLPVLRALRADGGFELKVVVSRWLAKESPRTGALLQRAGQAFTYVRRRKVIEGAAPSLRDVRAVLSTAESTAATHAAGHALAQRANRAGVRTYTLQHGLENIGLFGFEARAATFASQTVFCWFPAEATPPDLDAGTRAKLDHCGRPYVLETAGAAEFDLGVFENLHWDRYSDADRAAFLGGLAAASRALPSGRILLRAHPAGAWADGRSGDLVGLDNVVVTPTAQARESLESAAAVLRRVRRVVTTPSTVALDAAMAGLPTAIAGAGGPPYAPLPELADETAWATFAAGAPFDMGLVERFRDRVLVPGDAAARIVARLHAGLADTATGLPPQPSREVPASD